MDDHYKPGALSWLTRPLELGTATFPDLIPGPRAPAVVPPELDDDARDAARLGWPGEGGWCE